MALKAHSADVANISAPSDNSQNEHNSEPLKTLGGELLTNPTSARIHSTDSANHQLPEMVVVTANQEPTSATDTTVTNSHGQPEAKATDAQQNSTKSVDANSPTNDGTNAQPLTDAQRQQISYDQAHGEFQKNLVVYWDKVSAAKKQHQFVMDFPPVYSGPDKPKPPGTPPVVKPNTVPTLNQMLEDSKHLNQAASGDASQPEFNLRQVSESQFKAGYAKEAINIGQQYGLNKDDMKDIVRGIYAFEDGGWGTHETMSNMPQSLVQDDKPGQTTIQDARRDYHATGATASSALGYNQLMMANSVEDVTEQSQPMAARLRQLAQDDPTRAKELNDKADMLGRLSGSIKTELMNMVNETKKTDPDKAKKYLDSDGGPTELLYQDFQKSPEPTASGISRQDLARGVHALNLDGDIGPVLQAQEMGNLVKYSNRFGYPTMLQGQEQNDKQAVAAFDALPADQKAKAVQEVMNLVKDPTSGSSASDTTKQKQFDATKAELEQRLMALQPGIDTNLAKDHLSTQEQNMISSGIFAEKSLGETTGPLPSEAQLLLHKITDSYYSGLTASKMMPAALELANLAGPKNAQGMIDPKNTEVPTTNFFAQNGYYANPVTNGRTGPELLLQIKRSMSGPNNDASVRPGQIDFEQAFAQS